MSAFPGKDIIDLSNDDDKLLVIVISDDEATPPPEQTLPRYSHVNATVDDGVGEELPQSSLLPLAAILPEMQRPSERNLTFDDMEHLFRKVTTRVHVKSRREAKAFGDRYSALRPQDDTLAIFCDGSGSEHIPEALAKIRFHHLQGTAAASNFRNKRYISAGIAYKTDPSREGWHRRGFPTPHLWSTTNGELFGFKEGLAKFKHLHLHCGHTHLKRLLLFSDAQGIVEFLQTIHERRTLPNWDLHLLREVMELLIELVETHGLEVDIHWVPAHMGVIGNELADYAVGLARPDRLWPEMYPISVGGYSHAHRTGRRANVFDPTPSESDKSSERRGKSNRGTKRARSSVDGPSVSNVAGCNPDIPIEVSGDEEDMTEHRPKKQWKVAMRDEGDR